MIHIVIFNVSNSHWFLFAQYLAKEWKEQETEVNHRLAEKMQELEPMKQGKQTDIFSYRKNRRTWANIDFLID